jgi:predicted transcriptional regulator
MTLGINEIESTIVLEVLKKEQVTISNLAKVLSLSRTTIYKHIDILLKKDILEQPSGKLTYHIKNKDELKNHISNNLMQAEEETLYLLEQKKTEIPEIHTYNGLSGIGSIYEDIGVSLKKNDVYYRYTSRKEDTKKNKIYSEMKEKKEIERLVITSIEKAGSKSRDPNRFIKTVPKDFAFDDNISLIIYGSKIAHIDHKTNSAITITSKSMARFQEKIFKLLWTKL